jgi:ribonucleoside-diphosphate reductase alpha chain
MRLAHQITAADDADPFVGLSWKTVDIEIYSADPADRVCLTDIEVPAHWSYSAAQTFARYYIRRAGIPVVLTKVSEAEIPQFLWRSVPDTAALMALPEELRTTQETSARQVFLRLAGMWTYWGVKAGYFDTHADAKTFHDEICTMLARQVMAPNSPQWFNTGLFWAYGMEGPAQGHFIANHETGRVQRSINAYERPQLSACFIHGVNDELVNEGGIMHLFEREARVFKYGAGAGANVSAIRGAGEELSGGANALGLMRFLSVGDKAAGAIRAGGLPRRAGKMVVVDIDHPDVVGFVRWKGEEQFKAAALITGARVMRQHLGAVMSAIQHQRGEGRFNPAQNNMLKLAIAQARGARIPAAAIERVMAYAREGYRELHIPIYTAEDGAEVFFTVGAHQTTQAVRVTHRFMQAAEDNEKFALRRRTDGGVCKQIPATELLDDLAHAVWAAGDPTIHFADTIARAHTCPETDKIRASTPASEFLFLDDTACPLAAINLLACADAKGMLDIPLLRQAVRLTTIMLDISVTMAQYPSRAMARRTTETRPIGVGFANFAALLTRMGYAYTSEEAQATVAAIAALITGEACLVSAELAKELGEFAEFAKNRSHYLKWIASRHAGMTTGESGMTGSAIGLESLPQTELGDTARRVWEMASIKAEAYGMRNAQLSCVPPTSTIARIMDCETLGLAPLQTVVRFQPQANGTARKSLSSNIVYGLAALGYAQNQIDEMTRYVCGHRSLKTAPSLSHDALRAKGFGDDQLTAIEQSLAEATDIHAAFDPFVLGEKFCRESLKIPTAAMFNAQFSVLSHLGFSDEEIAVADAYACGTRTLDGAPHLSAEDVAVFSTTTDATAQIALLAAAQPFLTGGIAHTMLLPHATTVQQCKQTIVLAWRAGLKSVTLVREASALYEEGGLADDAAEAQEAREAITFTNPRTSLSGSISQVAAQLAQRFTQSRRELPPRRNGFTQKTSIGGHTIYLRSGEYADGSLGEIFIDTPDEPESYRALVQQFGRAISIALQYGVPMSAFVEAFSHQQFAPSGAVEGSGVMQEAASLLDYVFRELDAAYRKNLTAEHQANEKVVPLNRVVG